MMLSSFGSGLLTVDRLWLELVKPFKFHYVFIIDVRCVSCRNEKKKCLFIISEQPALHEIYYVILHIFWILGDFLFSHLLIPENFILNICGKFLDV